MAKVLEALTKINLDTDRLNQRIDTIEKTTSALSTTLSTPAANSKQHTTHQPATASFQLIYPTKEAVREPDQDQHESQNQALAQPGVCLFVSKKLDPSTWSCQLISQDYQLLKLRKICRDGNWTNIFIHNI